MANRQTETKPTKKKVEAQERPLIVETVWESFPMPELPSDERKKD